MFFFVFSAIVILSIAIFLTIAPLSKGSKTNDDENISVILQSPRELTMYLHEEVNLLDGFLLVYPQESVGDINVEISSRSALSKGGLQFDNFTLRASIVGYYYVTFSINLDEDRKVSDTLTVNVRDANPKAELSACIFEVGQEINLNDILTINSNFNYTINISNENVFKLEDNILFAVDKGSANLEITFSTEYFTFKYTFYIVSIVPEKDNFDISIIEIKKDGGLIVVEYLVTNNNKQYVNQVVRAEVDDESKAIILEISAPLIYIQPASDNSFYLTIYFADIYKQIEIDPKLI